MSCCLGPFWLAPEVVRGKCIAQGQSRGSQAFPGRQEQRPWLTGAAISTSAIRVRIAVGPRHRVRTVEAVSQHLSRVAGLASLLGGIDGIQYGRVLVEVVTIHPVIGRDVPNRATSPVHSLPNQKFPHQAPRLSLPATNIRPGETSC